MPGKSRPELDAAVLVAGDAEADLGALVRVLHAAPLALTLSSARGVPAACAALRDVEYAVVVADVDDVTDALAVLRAAGRARPPARVICLLPADSADDRWVEYVLRSAHAVERHPISEGGLIDLVGRAVDDYRRAREMVTRLLPRDARGQDGWRQAERDLAEALAAFVQVHASEPEHHLPAPDHVAAEISRHVRSGDGGVAVLRAIAGALSPRAGRDTGKEAA